MESKFILKLLFIVPVFLFSNQAWDDGSSFANSILNNLKSNMDSRINNPISKGTDLYTLDNSKHSKVSITCGKDKPFIKVGYTGTSDINIYVNGDLNFDDSYEKTWSFYGISGICANGVIKCNPNSWSNCKYYKWNFNGNLYLSETDRNNLGGCYCINSSCGNLASSEKGRILNDLAGAIASVIKDSRMYIVSNISQDGRYDYIYGRSINCEGESIPTNVNGDNIESLAQQKQIQEESDDNSVYSYVISGSNNANKNSNIVDNDLKNKIKQRDNEVQNSATFNKKNNSFSYEADGKNIQGDIQNGTIKDFEYCEIKYPIKDTSANYDNTTKNTKTYKTKIVQCNKSGNNWICPVNAGETILHDCGKIDDFAEVTSALNSLSDAVKDLTCSKK